MDGIHEASYSSFKLKVEGTGYLRALEPSEKVEGGRISVIAVTGVDTEQEGAVDIEFRTSDDAYMFSGTTCEVYDGAGLAPVDSRSMAGEHHVKEGETDPCVSTG